MEIELSSFLRFMSTPLLNSPKISSAWLDFKLGLIYGSTLKSSLFLGT